jgi:hypothetical protein
MLAVKAEAERDYLALSLVPGLKRLAQVLVRHAVGDHIGRVACAWALDEVAQLRGQIVVVGLLARLL